MPSEQNDHSSEAALSGIVEIMTEIKALPPPPAFLALPNYTRNLSEYFVEPELVDSLVRDLAELVSIRVAELRLEHTDRYMNECRARLLRAAKNERREPLREQLRMQLSDLIVGASLVINPLPQRKSKRHQSDYEALYSDWLTAGSDAGKVWHTMSYCLQPFVKNLSDDTVSKRARRRKPFAADR
jgi:hypothetical protein